ncbi:hypothetical protein Tco_1277390, partial [Tanacetum coccineum]
DAEEEINTSREEINTGIEEATHKTKEQLRQEEAGLEQAIKLQAQLDEEVAKQIHLDKMIAKRMVDMVNQRKKHFAEERAKIDTFVPINLEATKAKLKRYGEELQTKTSKKQRIDDKDVPAIGEKVAEVKEEEPVKRTGKRKKQKARKGINVDKSAQEDSETDKEESVEAMNPTPLTTKSDSVANWKIFQQGQRSVYQIIRANGADTVYMSFGAMIKDFIEKRIYRVV